MSLLGNPSFHWCWSAASSLYPLYFSVSFSEAVRADPHTGLWLGLSIVRQSVMTTLNSHSIATTLALLATALPAGPLPLTLQPRRLSCSSIYNLTILVTCFLYHWASLLHPIFFPLSLPSLPTPHVEQLSLVMSTLDSPTYPCLCLLSHTTTINLLFHYT